MKLSAYIVVVLSMAVYLCFGSDASTQETDAPIPIGRSIWKHNGSAVYLVADGARREFRYQKPKWKMEEIGAKPGTLLFDGRRDGDKYIGKAYVFSKQCGPISYAVTGSTSADQRRVALKGRLPVLNSSCQQVSALDDVLIFDFVFRNEANVVLPPPPPPPSVKPIKASILANPKENFASDIQLSRPSEDETAQSIVWSISASGRYSISTCFAGADPFASTSDDYFVAYYFIIVSFYGETSAVLTKLGYPEAVWGTALYNLAQGLLDEIVKRRSLNQSFGYRDLHEAVNGRREKLVQTLKKYRMESNPQLFAIEDGSFCGGDSRGRFELKLTPHGGRIWLMPNADYDYCKKRGYDLMSEKCDFWQPVAVYQQVPFGRYRYRVEWPDGVKEVERLPPVVDWAVDKMTVPIGNKTIEIFVKPL
jgi:hypothetical protein